MLVWYTTTKYIARGATMAARVTEIFGKTIYFTFNEVFFFSFIFMGGVWVLIFCHNNEFENIIFIIIIYD